MTTIKRYVDSKTPSTKPAALVFSPLGIEYFIARVLKQRFPESEIVQTSAHKETVIDNLRGFDILVKEQGEDKSRSMDVKIPYQNKSISATLTSLLPSNRSCGIKRLATVYKYKNGNYFIVIAVQDDMMKYIQPHPINTNLRVIDIENMICENSSSIVKLTEQERKEYDKLMNAYFKIYKKCEDKSIVETAKITVNTLFPVFKELYDAIPVIGIYDRTTKTEQEICPDNI